VTEKFTERLTDEEITQYITESDDWVSTGGAWDRVAFHALHKKQDVIIELLQRILEK
jgi:hypothetical protein